MDTSDVTSDEDAIDEREQSAQEVGEMRNAMRNLSKIQIGFYWRMTPALTRQIMMKRRMNG